MYYHPPTRKPEKKKGKGPIPKEALIGGGIILAMVVIFLIIRAATAPAPDSTLSPSATQNVLGDDFVAMLNATPGPTPAPTAEPGPMPLLVNRKNPVPNDYVPSNMVLMNDYCPQDVVIIKEPNTYGEKEAVDALLTMIRDAQAQGLEIWQVSDAYRSVADQQRIWDESYQKYLTVNELSPEKSTQAADRRVARGGASEHHIGLAFDISVPGESFRKTKQCDWLASNCTRYGFIIRYTEEKESITGTTAEPWHVRYVGEWHAKKMQREDLCLEEYITKYGQ